MKILVVSLLRLGDIIQQLPLLKGLRLRHPQAQIHILLNKQFSGAVPLLADLVDDVHYFDRDGLQKGIGEASYNILWPFTVVTEQISDLKSQNFDQVYNFTHTKLSAYLVGLLEVPVQGLSYENGKFTGLSSRWMFYFNERFSGTRKSHFHYIEALSSALNIPLKLDSAVMQSEVSAAEDLTKKDKLILLQCLTSDQKKNWGLQRFSRLKKTLESALNGYTIKVLAAEFEKEALSAHFSADDILVCSLPETQELLKRASLLITGDTSIKHLAARAGTPLVELVLGSSDHVKTGAFTAKSLAVKSSAPCAPCSHASKCSQPSQICAQMISVESVFSAAWDVLHLKPFPKLYSPEQNLTRQIWQHYLDQKTDVAVAENAFLDCDFSKILHLHDENILWMQRLELALQNENTWKYKNEIKPDDLSDFIFIAQDILKRGPNHDSGFFQRFIETLIGHHSSGLSLYTEIESSFLEAQELIHIQHQILTQTKSVTAEEHRHAKEIRDLPVSSFTEARRRSEGNPQDADL